MDEMDRAGVVDGQDSGGVDGPGGPSGPGGSAGSVGPAGSDGADPPPLPCAEIAERAGVVKSTAWRWIQRGNIQPVGRDARGQLYHEREVLAYSRAYVRSRGHGGRRAGAGRPPAARGPEDRSQVARTPGRHEGNAIAKGPEWRPSREPAPAPLHPIAPRRVVPDPPPPDPATVARVTALRQRLFCSELTPAEFAELMAFGVEDGGLGREEIDRLLAACTLMKSQMALRQQQGTLVDAESVRVAMRAAVARLVASIRRLADEVSQEAGTRAAMTPSQVSDLRHWIAARIDRMEEDARRRLAGEQVEDDAGRGAEASGEGAGGGSA